VSDLHTQNKVTAQPNHFTSLRGFLAALDQMNDLHEVRREVDTDLEIGAIIRRTHETYAPAPLFTNIRGHAGYRVVGAGTIIAPPVPAFYTRPSTLHDMIDQTVGRVLDLFGIDTATFPRWGQSCPVTSDIQPCAAASSA
jgi:3-octaprenyl-4-hydroxybenzoate carboxy-lyase